MTQRSRTRSAGAIDSNISTPVTIPPMPPWVSGRFYTSYALIGALATVVADTNCYCIPILVPNDIIITSIGLEVTSAGTAGALIRLGIYDSDSVTYLPSNRLVDAGTVAGDAVAFASAVISLYLRPGHYWAVAAYYTPTTYPTIRSLPVTALHAIFSTVGRSYLTQDSQPVFKVGASATFWAREGLPRRMTTVSSDSSETALLQVIGSSKVPRILLGI